MIHYVSSNLTYYYCLLVISFMVAEPIVGYINKYANEQHLRFDAFYFIWQKARSTVQKTIATS